MLIKTDQTVFDSLDDTMLSWECIKSFIFQVRGKDLTTKSGVFHDLNPAQQALFSFHVFYNHAVVSAKDLYYWTNYYKSLGFLKEIKAGIAFFGESGLISVIEHIENKLLEIENSDEIASERIAFDNKIYLRLKEESERALLQMAGYIRKHPYEFVEFI